MSMSMLTICQIAGILAAYCIVIIVLPYLFLQKRLAKYTASEQIAGYFLVGNFYVIYLVFLLQFLKMSCQATLLIGTAMPFILVRLHKRKGHIISDINDLYNLILNILRKETGFKTIFTKLNERFFKPHLAKLAKRIIKYAPDIILTLLIAAGVFYIYGYAAITEFGYKASDIPVHNFWVNEMTDNNIFSQGVYPHGFHCIIYYFHTAFGIKTYTLLRVFALIQTLFIYLTLLLSLKIICKSRFTPYIGTAVYLMIEMSADLPFSRFLSTLPQEYGMLFIMPAGALAIRFFQEYAAMLAEKDNDKKEDIKKRVIEYLAGFAISFSLTLTVHFYDTMPAGIFCVGIAIGYCFRFCRWRYFWRIMLTGIISVMLAVLPMAVGVAVGHPLQGSLYWGLNVINGTANESEQTETIVIDKNGNEIHVVGDVDEEFLEQLINGGEDIEWQTVSGKEASEKDSIEYETEGEDIKEKESTLKSLGTGLKLKFQLILKELEMYCTNSSETVALIMLGAIAALLVLGLLSMLLRKVDYGGMLLSVGFYMVFMLIFQSTVALGLPELMQPSRVCIFFCYAMGLVWALVADGVLYIVFGWMKKKTFMNFLALLSIAAGSYTAVSCDRVRNPMTVNALEPNEAIVCLENIIKQHDNFTWTLVSANDERQMILDYGFHYEMITFLREIRNIKNNKEITIPTEHVYFFIEKQPINYAGSANGLELKRVSEEGASLPINMDSGTGAYQTDERWNTMSHMYYWALEFQKIYPNEMQVYYETDDFVCYYLHQNVESVYNLAIDYGYNNPKRQEE